MENDIEVFEFDSQKLAPATGCGVTTSRSALDR